MEIQTNIKLTSDDLDILDSYKTLCEGLSVFLGDGFEILLYSLENTQRPVSKSAGGIYAGEAGGAPLSRDTLEILSSAFENSGNKYVSYFCENKKGIPMKSAVLALSGQGGRTIALLFINFYLNTSILQLINSCSPSYTGKTGFQISGRPGDLSSGSDEAAANLVKNICRQVISDSDISAVNKNKEIISRLHNLGFFKIKNSVQRCADVLGISRNTVYLHIRNIKKDMQKA